jgi:myo-inositol-1(or 4)-monophosphatase
VVNGRILATSPGLHLPLKQELARVTALPPTLYGA